MLPNGQPDFSQVIAKDRPVRHVLAYGPQQAVGPLAVEPADVAAVSPDFAPDSWVTGLVHKGAALVGREGDFGFSPSNGNPEEGHDVQLVNFSQANGVLRLNLLRFAFNCRQADQRRNADGSAWCAGGSDQAFEAPANNPIRGINRPTNTMFGPDGALYVVDFGAVRDFGVSSGGDARFLQAADAPLVQIPHTGVIWRIARTATGS
jgi:hypothetical protein